MSDFISYHGTTSECAESIMSDGFYDDIPPVNKHSGKKYPNDLGYGTYSFIDADDMNFDKPNENARKYPVYQQRCKESEVSVIKIESSVEKNKILNLNLSINISNLIKLKKVVHQAALLQIGEYRSGKAKNRGNTDGLLLEYCFKKGLIKKPDAIIKDSYTPFDGYYSKIPNGREFVIRNLSVITSKTVL